VTGEAFNPDRPPRPKKRKRAKGTPDGDLRHRASQLLRDRNRRMATDLEKGRWLVARFLQADADGRRVSDQVTREAKQWARSA